MALPKTHKMNGNFGSHGGSYHDWLAKGNDSLYKRKLVKRVVSKGRRKLLKIRLDLYEE